MNAQWKNFKAGREILRINHNCGEKILNFQVNDDGYTIIFNNLQVLGKGIPHSIFFKKSEEREMDDFLRLIDLGISAAMSAERNILWNPSEEVGIRVVN